MRDPLQICLGSQGWAKEVDSGVADIIIRCYDAKVQRRKVHAI